MIDKQLTNGSIRHNYSLITKAMSLCQDSCQSNSGKANTFTHLVTQSKLLPWLNRHTYCEMALVHLNLALISTNITDQNVSSTGTFSNEQITWIRNVGSPVYQEPRRQGWRSVQLYCITHPPWPLTHPTPDQRCRLARLLESFSIGLGN